MKSHENYEVFESLGQGADTEVFRAYDRSLRRYVAIKCLREEVSRDARRASRFIRQAQFLAGLDHDHVLKVHALESEQGWIVMELLPGSMRTRLNAGTIDADLARSVLRQSLEALQYLHGKNKIHGKITPSNILVNDQGRVKLSDFEDHEGGGELPRPAGDGKYLAPELLKPEFGAVGPQLDLYCLGFTILELVTGPRFVSLFPGLGHAIDPKVAWMRWHGASDRLPPVQELAPQLPADLCAALDAMLPKVVGERAPSAAAVLKSLSDAPLKAVDLPRGTAPPAPPTTPNETPPTPGPPQGAPTGGGGKPRGGKAKFSLDLSDRKVFFPVAAVVLLLAAVVGLLLQRMLEPPTPEGFEVAIRTQPQAAVLQGDTPLKPIEKEGHTYRLPAGQHKLTLQAKGRTPRTVEITVDDAHLSFGPYELEPELELEKTAPAPVRIVVAKDPAVALWIGGEEMTPVDSAKGVYELLPGTYSARLIQAEHETLETQFVVDADHRQFGPFKLRPTTVEPEPLVVEIDGPVNAKVHVDGQAQPLPPIAGSNNRYLLKPGKHQLSLTMDKFLPLLAEIDVTPQSTKFGPYSLTPIDAPKPSPTTQKIAISVMPKEAGAAAELTVAGVPVQLDGGAGVWELNPDEAPKLLEVEVVAAGFERFGRFYTTSQLVFDGQLTINLKKNAAGTSQTTEMPENLVNARLDVARGLRLLSSGETEAAIRAFSDAIEQAPKYQSAWVYRAEARILAEDLPGAASDYREALRIAPSAEVYVSLGNFLADQGQTQPALDAYAKALEIDPRAVTAHTGAALVHYLKSDWENAEKSARAAVDANPRYSPAHNLLGLALWAGGKLPAAEQAFSQAIDSDGKNHEALYNRGRLRFQRVDAAAELEGFKLRDQAIEDLTEAIRLKTLLKEANGIPQELALCYFVRSRALASGGATERAVADATQAIELHASAAVYEHRAGLYQQIGKFDQAKQDAAAAARLKER